MPQAARDTPFLDRECTEEMGKGNHMEKVLVLDLKAVGHNEDIGPVPLVVVVVGRTAQLQDRLGTGAAPWLE